MLKSQELRTPHSCLNKSQPEEPVFVLVARDPTAAQTVRLWVAMNSGTQPPDKLQDALRAAEEMDKWHGQQAKMAPVWDGHSIPTPLPVPPSYKPDPRA